MDTQYITCFITATCKVFETMLNLPVETGSPTMKEPGKPAHDVSAIVGLGGDMEGSVVLSFPVTSAQRIVSLFSGANLEPNHPDFADAIGELVNMIAGGAKALFKGFKVAITCPSVVIGSDHLVFGRKDTTCVVIPCTCDCGDFAVQVALRPAENSGSADIKLAASA